MTGKSSYITTNLGFALTLVILGSLVLSCFFSGRAFIRSKDQRRAARQRTLQLSDLWIAVEAAETAQRGYLLTQEPDYLAQFPLARAQKDVAIRNLRGLFAADDHSQQEISALDTILTDKFSELAETVRLTQTGDRANALAIVKSNYGQHLTVEARKLYQQLKERSEHEMEVLRAEGEAVLSRGFWMVGETCALAMLALMAAIVVVNIDSAKRRHIEADLRAANLEAHNATAAKSMFLATMSHELRTPLNAICGMSDLLMEGQLEAEHRNFAEVISHSAIALLSLVNDVLDFSKIEAGKLELESANFSPTPLMQTQLEIVSGQAKKKGLALHYEIDPTLPPFLRGDPGRIGQIILNLLSNALKFTQTGSVTVRLTALSQSDAKTAAVRFEVIDTGMGMSEAQASRLFRPFSQVHEAPQTTYGGTGLGLAICRRLVDLMHGEIGVRPNPTGGSTFWLELGLAVPEIGMAPPAASVPHELLTRAANAALGADAKPVRHILVAEDNAVNQLLIAKQLERLGYTSHIVANGVEALDAMSRKSYDLVLMDCQMPEMDGYEAARRIRAQEMQTGKHVPILALTASAVRGDAEKCVAAGMDGHLTKPLGKELLGQTIDVWIARSTTSPI